MTIVFLKFSDRANAHRSVRLPSRAVHIFPAVSLDAYSPHIGIFSYCFPTKLCTGPYEFKTLFYNSVIPKKGLIGSEVILSADYVIQ